MYLILYDLKTNGIYMPPGDISFYVYSDISHCISRPLKTYLLETEYDTEDEIKTVLWKAGFLRGFIDDEPVTIRPVDVLAFGRNANDIYYSQYLLTNKKEYLEGVSIKDLWTLCKLEDENALFPTIKKDNLYYIFAYTSSDRISKELMNKYPDYKMIKITFNVPFLLNEKIYISEA